MEETKAKVESEDDLSSGIDDDLEVNESDPSTSCNSNLWQLRRALTD